MSCSSSPKGTPHELVSENYEKKTILQWKPMDLGWWFLKKLMNMFTGDLYSMYVVLQGIGSLPCIRVYIISVIPFGK